MRQGKREGFFGLPGCWTVPVLLLALAATVAHAGPNEARREKAAYLWQRINADSYSRNLTDFFCREHELQGIADQWWYSLVYCTSGSDLKPAMTCSGGGMTARGIGDCTELLYPRDQARRRFGTTSLHDPQLGIANHVFQAMGLHQSSGAEDWDLMRRVFLPSRHEGARAYKEQRRWRGIEKRHLQMLAQGYAAGKLVE